MERGSGRFENITHAADRMDQFCLKRIVHLCPQPANYHIDDVRVGSKSDVPDVLCNFIARYYFADRTRQMSEQEKLFRRKVQRNAAALGALMTCSISKSSTRSLSRRAGVRRKSERTRASNSENANGFTT